MSEKKPKETSVSENLTLEATIEKRFKALEKELALIRQSVEKVAESRAGVKIQNPVVHVITSLTNKLQFANTAVTIAKLKALYQISPGSVISLILTFIAKEMDDAYDNNIRDLEQVYIYSLLNGKIYAVNKDEIKSYKNVAAFRSKDEAIVAVKVLKSIIKTCIEK